MVFLNPSILFGLIAASIPIIIHLLNFRKLKKIEFSTLSFIKELQKSRIRKIKIKQWLLLLLRTLIIISIVLAFSKPTLKTTMFTGSTSSAKTSSVFIIDNSFSMNYIRDNGSNFNLGRKIAKDIISNMKDDDEFFFIFSSDSSRMTTSKTEALNFIDNLNINLKVEQINKKIDKAVSLLNESNNINKEIFIFSDFQATTFNTDLQTDSIASKEFHDGIKFYSFDLGIKSTSNYSISELKLNNSIIELNRPITFTATLNNYSETKQNNLIASLFINQKRVAQKSISISSNGSVNIDLQTSLMKAGLIEAMVSVEADNITYDNTRFLSFFLPEKIKVLLLYENESDINFVETALNSLASLGQVEVTQQKIIALGNSDLKNYELVLYLGAQGARETELKNYILDGGNLFFIPTKNATIDELQKLEQSIGLPRPLNIVESKNKEQNYSEFGEIDFSHPIFLSLFKLENKKEIESPMIYKYIKFAKSPSYNSIVKLIDGSVFLGEVRLGKGRVLFINSAVSLDWNNLPVKSIFAPLISRSVYYLASSYKEINNYLIGDKIPIKITNLSYPQINVQLPKGSEKLNIEDFNKEYIYFGNTYLPGNYKFFNKNNLISSASVNINEIESDLRKKNDEDINLYFNKMFTNNYLKLDYRSDYFLNIAQARFGTELWKYFMILTFILAIIEMYIARSTKKEIAELN